MPEDAQLDELAQELARALAHDVTLALGAAERASRSALFRHLGERGHADIRPAHLPVFAGIESGGSRISELAARAGLTRQAMSMLVRDVEAVGYVSTAPDPDDGRAVLVQPTPRGVTFCRDIARSSRAVSAEIEQRLGAARLADILDGVRAIADPHIARE